MKRTFLSFLVVFLFGLFFLSKPVFPSELIQKDSAQSEYQISHSLHMGMLSDIRLDADPPFEFQTETTTQDKSPPFSTYVFTVAISDTYHKAYANPWNVRYGSDNILMKFSGNPEMTQRNQILVNAHSAQTSGSSHVAIVDCNATYRQNNIQHYYSSERHMNKNSERIMAEQAVRIPEVVLIKNL